MLKTRIQKHLSPGTAASNTNHFLSQPLVHVETSCRKPQLGLDFNIIRLDRDNVQRSKIAARKEPKKEALFQGMLQLLRDNFPGSEIENEAQYRRYFFDRYSKNWFVDVAVDDNSKVIGASLYSYSQEMNIVMYNIVAVEKGARLKGIAGSLVSSMVESGGKRAVDATGKNLLYVIGEIEQPIGELKDDMRNKIRPAFHDKISQLRAIRLKNGEPLIYLLPIMATEPERKAAALVNEPFEPEPLMFCLRPLSSDESKGVSSHEIARLLMWFYKDYLETECSDVRKEEVNQLLATALSKLAPTPKQYEIELLLQGGRRNLKKILAMIPEEQLQFIKISEAAV